MHFVILTPERTVFEGEVDAAHVPGAQGPFEILSHHAPIVSALNAGPLRLSTPKKEEVFFVSGGFVEFAEEKGVVLADAAESPGQIDVKRARAAKERARNRLAGLGADRVQNPAAPKPGTEGTLPLDKTRAQRALSRALGRERFAEQYPKA